MLLGLAVVVIDRANDNNKHGSGERAKLALLRDEDDDDDDEDDEMNQHRASWREVHARARWRRCCCCSRTAPVDL